MDIYEKACLCCSPSMIPSSSDALYHPHHQKVAVTPRVSKPREKTQGTEFLPGEVDSLVSCADYKLSVARTSPPPLGFFNTLCNQTLYQMWL